MTHRDQRVAAIDEPVARGTPILIIDSDRRVGAALRVMLSARGYRSVRAVRSGLSALAFAEKLHPGIVFLDIELRDMDSMALARQLQRDGKRRALRLIALTSTIEHATRERARIAGFERYFVKPVTSLELDRILHAAPGATSRRS